MFNLFAKKSKGETVTLQLSGLHCASCSLNIDDALSEVKGVISSKTSYASQKCMITYNPALTSPKEIFPLIQELGYQIIR